MFATVELKEGQTGLRAFFRDLFSEPEIELIRNSLPEGDCFYRVLVTEHRGGLPISQLCEKLKKLKGSVIFNLDFPTGEVTRCLEFHPRSLPCFLLFNSFCDYISSLGLTPAKASLCIFDQKGIYPELTERLIKLFGKIEVYTKNTDLYDKAARTLMEKYGVVLTVRNRFKAEVPASTVILSPDRLPFCDFFKGIIFTLGEKAPPCSCLIRGDGIDLPAELELLRPGGIDKMTFACALFEKAGVTSLSRLSFKNLRIT